MKILIMTSLWGRHGGKEHFLECVIAELAEADHECVVAYGRLSSRPLMMEMPEMKAYCLQAYSETRSADEEQGVGQLEALLKAEAPDAIFMCDLRNLRMLSVLHAYGGTVTMSHDNWLTCMRGLTTSYFTRTICTKKLGPGCLLHGCFVRKSHTGDGLVFNNLLDHMAMLKSYRRFPVHLVASRYMKNRLLLHDFKSEQVQVAGYFTDLEPETRETEQEAVPTILFAGRIDRYKGVDFLLRALVQIDVPFRCIVVGDGPALADCEKLATRLGLGSKVEFLGWQSRQAVRNEFLNASVLAVTSVWPEAFGLIGLEAMTCAKPVVAFETGGIPDWLENGVNGYLVPVKRVDLLAEKLEVLLRNPTLAKAMGAAGQRIAQTRFSRAAFFDRFMTLLRTAAEQRIGNRVPRDQLAQLSPTGVTQFAYSSSGPLLPRVAEAASQGGHE